MYLFHNVQNTQLLPEKVSPTVLGQTTWTDMLKGKLDHTLQRNTTTFSSPGFQCPPRFPDFPLHTSCAQWQMRRCPGVGWQLVPCGGRGEGPPGDESVITTPSSQFSPGMLPSGCRRYFLPISAALVPPKKVRAREMEHHPQIL